MTDITALTQMKGQKVDGSYYLAECMNCGEMYPSNKLNGGEPLFAGDYGECYCPHCHADDTDIADCGAHGSDVVTAWNYQQNRIDALVEALEAEQQKSAKQGRHACELFDEVKQLQEQLRTVELSNSVLESRTVTVKLPELCVGVVQGGHAVMVPYAAGHWFNKMAILEMLAAAGIQVIEGEQRNG